VVVNRTDEWGDFHKVWAGTDNRDDFYILHFLKNNLMCYNLVDKSPGLTFRFWLNVCTFAKNHGK
jgi:hypothetical protein